MITEAEHLSADVDDRRYLYPHALTPAVSKPASRPADAAPAGRRSPIPAEAGSGLVGVAPFGQHGYETERAVIGDSLRIPLVWCQFGSCIARFTDPAALGESDLRSRAAALGWRQDALGRLACPNCVQYDPTFMISYPPVTRSNDRQDAHPPDEAVPDPADDLAPEDVAAHDVGADDLSLESLPLESPPLESPPLESPPLESLPAEDCPVSAQVSPWDGELPRMHLAFAPDPDSGRPAWWRRREAGRHR